MAGRPTLYKPEYCEMIVNYFRDSPIFVEKKIKVFDKKTQSVEEIDIKEPCPCPTMIDFADKIDVNIDTLNEWAKVHPEFSVAKKKASSIQERWLLNAGGLGYFKDSMAIISLKANHKWKDRSEVEQTGGVTVTMNMVQKDGKPLKYNIGKEKTNE